MSSIRDRVIGVVIDMVPGVDTKTIARECPPEQAPVRTAVAVHIRHVTMRADSVIGRVLNGPVH